jgi:hypothetical protein
MNRSINILLLVFSMPAMAFTIFVAFDLPIDFLNTTAALLDYRDKVFLVLALLLLLLVIRRSVSRWVGVGMTRKPDRFIWCTSIGTERKKQVKLFLFLEALVAFVFTGVTYDLTPEAWPIALAYGLFFLDQIIFMLVAPSWFRVGVTQKAVVVADRELRVLYFSGLRRVEVHQQTLYFEYIEELQLSFPINCVPEGEYEAFRNAVESRVNRDKVFFSEKFKGLK